MPIFVDEWGQVAPKVVQPAPADPTSTPPAVSNVGTAAVSNAATSKPPGTLSGTRVLASVPKQPVAQAVAPRPGVINRSIGIILVMLPNGTIHQIAPGQLIPPNSHIVTRQELEAANRADVNAIDSYALKQAKLVAPTIAKAIVGGGKMALDLTKAAAYDATHGPKSHRALDLLQKDIVAVGKSTGHTITHPGQNLTADVLVLLGAKGGLKGGIKVVDKGVKAADARVGGLSSERGGIDEDRLDRWRKERFGGDPNKDHVLEPWEIIEQEIKAKKEKAKKNKKIEVATPASNLPVSLRQLTDTLHSLKAIKKLHAEDFTLSHTMGVAKYTRDIIEAFNDKHPGTISKSRKDIIVAGAVMHDLGKVYEAIRPLLTKALKDDAKTVIEQHPYWGVKFAEAMGVTNKTILNIIGRHHEGQTSGGYGAFSSPAADFRTPPADMLKTIGHKDVLNVQIVKAADAFEAMTDPKRAGVLGRGNRSPEEAIAILKADVAKGEFNKQVVVMLEKALIDKGVIEGPDHNHR